jgi:hypothetical protein
MSCLVVPGGGGKQREHHVEGPLLLRRGGRHGRRRYELSPVAMIPEQQVRDDAGQQQLVANDPPLAVADRLAVALCEL